MQGGATAIVASGVAAAVACAYVVHRWRSQAVSNAAVEIIPASKVDESAAKLPSTPSILKPNDAVGTDAATRVQAETVSPVSRPNFEQANELEQPQPAELSVAAAPATSATGSVLSSVQCGGDARPSRAGTAPIEDAAQEIERYHAMRREFNDRNKSITRQWEQQEWNKAKAKLDERVARAEAEAEAGVETLAQRSQRIVAEMRAAAAAREAEEAARPSSALQASASKEEDDEATRSAVKPERKLPGATEESVRAELDRWPKPPLSAVTNPADAPLAEHGIASGATSLSLTPPHDWPLYLDHFDWMDEIASRYAFADAGEVMRHLIFCANGETPAVKKLIFLIIRCLHCHSGARAGHIPKREKPMSIFTFQLQWLHAVQQRSKHPSVEKTVRVICDYCTSPKPTLSLMLPRLPLPSRELGSP